ncbi:MAG: SIR2 family protein [Candidatus Velthaea sp.]
MTELVLPTQTMHEIVAALDRGHAVPYLGPGLLSLAGENCPLPASPLALVERLTAKATVPHKIRKNLTAAAQFIENFKHRRTVKSAMTEAFRASVPPTDLHRLLAALPVLPLLVHAWYDDLPQNALAARTSWGSAQGVSQAEHFGSWVHYFEAGARPVDDAAWDTLLYQPFGSVSPAANFLVSDSDFVEVLTEIDIQTPIPERVQQLRTGRHFLFLGCRFATQLDRIFARQIMKRSSARHWAVLPEQPTRNELRFLTEQHIERIDTRLEDFAAALETSRGLVAAQAVAAGG